MTATDNEAGASGVQTVEYRTNGGAWTPYTAPVAFNTAGNYDVDYRATDKVNNTSAVKSVTFRILSGAGCTQARSDEFNGTALGAQWQRHTRNGGTPASAFDARAAASCTCRRPTSSSTPPTTTTSVGPVNFIGQDLAALGTNWQVETEFTVKYTGGWQNTGLIVWNGDNNFFRSSITHDLNGGNIYVEQSKDNPSSTEGARSQAGSNITIAPNTSRPVTIRMRYTRADGVQHGRRRSTGSWLRPRSRWRTTSNFGGAADFLNLEPDGGARRDAAGLADRHHHRSRTSRAPPAPTPTRAPPARSDVNYFRVTPDPIDLRDGRPDHDGDARPGRPGHGRHVRPRGQGQPLGRPTPAPTRRASRTTEYRITTNGVAGEWTSQANTRYESPFVNQVTVSSSGTHVVEYRSTDKAANTEETKSVTFKVKLPVCDRSDEFDGTEILPRWLRHTRNGGTPTTGPLAPTVSGGQLHLPTNDLEIDAADARRRSARSTCSARTCPPWARTGRSETQFTAQLPRRLAEHRPGRLERGQQLLPFHAVPQPEQQRDLRRELQGQPEHDRGHARHGRRQPEHPGHEHRPGHDQDALHARQRRQHRPGALPDRGAGVRGDRRLGRVPGHRRRSST